MAGVLSTIWYNLFPFYLLVCTVQSLHDLHTIVASNRDDLLDLFGVDSVNSVPEYEVAQVHHDRQRRDISETKYYRLSAFNKNFNLELEPNYEVVSPYLQVVRKTSANSWSKELYSPNGIFYHGHVTSDPESHVAVRDIMDDGRLSGSIIMDGRIYEVRPLPDHVARKIGVETRDHHVITRRSLKNNFNMDIVKVPPTESEEVLQENYHEKRMRREATPPKYYVEAMVLLDKISCDYYGNRSMDFVLAVANLVHRLYKDKSLTIDINWTVTKIILIEHFEEALDFTTQSIDSAVKYMGLFATWARVNNPANGEIGHYDNGVLLSRSICGTISCSLDGVAYSGVPCNMRLGYTVNRATGLDAAFSVAHEMGHNFGLSHDTGECKKGYIMNSGQASGANAFRWSNCSNKRLNNVFRRVTCYNNKPPSNYTLPVIPSGHYYSADKQCQLLHGDDYRECPVTKNSCTSLFCYKHTGCSSIGAPPVDGTRCGHRKWCIRGECVAMGDDVPSAIDGGWGAWSPTYSQCSRSCGGGVQYRTRKCNNPSPQFHGKPCQGSFIGEWKICNINECPSSNPVYRKTQCVQKGYESFYGRDGCSLWCVTKGVATLEGNVADGTKFFINQPHIKDICIDGKRQSVGCDSVLYSKTIDDRCMECGGSGSNCKPVNGSYNKNYKKYGPGNADPMFVVPSGASRMFVKENSATYNFLNLKLFPPGNHSLIFPNYPRSLIRKAAGVNVIYKIGDLMSAESMEFYGPTTEQLVVMFVYLGFHTNVGYKYKYYERGSAPNTAFTWKAVKGSCSRTCARGELMQKVTCHREDDQSQISPKHCDNSTRPYDVISCNEQPCPGRWEPQLWSPCSVKCAGGIHTREVPCVQQFLADNYTIVHDGNCNETIRPHKVEPCNVVDCPPEWVIGQWSQCIQNGSSFTSTRLVLCRTKLANGTIIYTDFSACTSQSNGFVPESKKNCTIPTTKPIVSTVLPPEEKSTKKPTTRLEPTTKILTIIPVRGRSTAEGKNSWVYAIVAVLLVIVAILIVLFILYRLGRFPSFCSSVGRKKPNNTDLYPLEKKKSVCSISSIGSADSSAGV